MLTQSEIIRELEAAGIGPVCMVWRFREAFALSQSQPYHMIATGKLMKQGKTITRDSIVKLLLTEPQWFCRLYDRNHKITKGKNE